jgi:hypothetical protein
MRVAGHFPGPEHPGIGLSVRGLVLYIRLGQQLPHRDVEIGADAAAAAVQDHRVEDLAERMDGVHVVPAGR